MSQLSHEDLLSLEQYHTKRDLVREALRRHKALRRIGVGPNVHLFFEDRKTMQYQIQEMLYVEKIIDAEDIQEELDTYNPMIPDGDNWKVTMMIEYEDEAERQQALQDLVMIENQVYVAMDGFDKVYAIADEDLDRADATKTSAVHFLRFQLNFEIIKALKEGANFYFGIDHKHYQYKSEAFSEETKHSLLEDLRK